MSSLAWEKNTVRLKEMPAPLTIIVLLVAVYVLAECINFLVIGSSLVRSICRIIRQKLHGSKEIELPDDLKLAAINGLFSVGSEMIVGDQCEWDETSVSRFSISPGITGEESGTVMKVIRLTRSRIELIPIGRIDHTTEALKGEQD